MADLFTVFGDIFKLISKVTTLVYIYIKSKQGLYFSIYMFLFDIINVLAYCNLTEVKLEH